MLENAALALASMREGRRGEWVCRQKLCSIFDLDYSFKGEDYTQAKVRVFWAHCLVVLSFCHYGLAY